MNSMRWQLRTRECGRPLSLLQTKLNALIEELTWQQVRLLEKSGLLLMLAVTAVLLLTSCASSQVDQSCSAATKTGLTKPPEMPKLRGQTWTDIAVFGRECAGEITKAQCRAKAIQGSACEVDNAD